MNDVEVVGLVAVAFGDCPRPEHFTDYGHCCECAEHDELLRTRNRDTLTVADVGNPGWDPICFITDAGFKYYFPALVRLALMEPTEERGWYLEQLLFHLNDKDTPQKRRAACSSRQREAVICFLRHILEARQPLVHDYLCEAPLRETIALWAHPTLERTL